MEEARDEVVCVVDLNVRALTAHSRDDRGAGDERPAEGRVEQGDPRPGMRRVPPPTRVQAGMARRLAHGGAVGEHQPDVSRMGARRGREPAEPGRVPVGLVWARGERGRRGVGQHRTDGARPDSLRRHFAPRGAGTPPRRARPSRPDTQQESPPFRAGRMPNGDSTSPYGASHAGSTGARRSHRPSVAIPGEPERR